MGEHFEITVNDENFEQEVLNAELPVIVDFWAEWCGPCKMIAPTVDEIAKELNGKVKVCKLNVDSGAKTAASYGVMNIPTLIFFNKGEVVDKIVGMASKGDIVARVSAHL